MNEFSALLLNQTGKSKFSNTYLKTDHKRKREREEEEEEGKSGREGGRKGKRKGRDGLTLQQKIPSDIFSALKIESIPIIMLTEPFVEDWDPMTIIPTTHGNQALEASIIRFNITIC